MLATTGDISIEAWIDPTNFTNYDSIVGKTSANLAVPYDLYLVTGTGIPDFVRGNGTAYGSAVGNAAPPTGAWSFFTVTMSGTNVQFYSNGVSNGRGTLRRP